MTVTDSLAAVPGEYTVTVKPGFSPEAVLDELDVLTRLGPNSPNRLLHTRGL
ncbi:hypothetical protein [Streptomyces mayteni]